MLVILQLSTLVWVFDGHVLGYLMGTYVLPTPFPWWLGVETISTPLYPLSMKTCLIIFNNNSPPKKPVQFSLSLIKTPQDILPFPVLDSWRRIIFPAVLIHNTTGYKCPSLRTVIWVAHNNSIYKSTSSEHLPQLPDDFWTLSIPRHLLADIPKGTFLWTLVPVG